MILIRVFSMAMLVVGLGFILYGVLFGFFPIFADTSKYLEGIFPPGQSELVDLTVEIMKEQPAILGFFSMIALWLPGVCISASALATWYVAGKQVAKKADRQLILAVRFAGLAGALFGVFFVLWSGVILLSGGMMREMFNRVIGIQLDVVDTVMTSVSCLILSLLSFVFGSGLLWISKLEE